MQKYSQQLKNIGVEAHAQYEVEGGQCGQRYRKEREEREEEREEREEEVREVREEEGAFSSEASPSSSARWLKCVSVSRLSSSSSEPGSVGESAEQTKTEPTSVIHQLCLPLAIPLTDVLQLHSPPRLPQAFSHYSKEPNPHSQSMTSRGEDTPQGFHGELAVGRSCSTPTEGSLCPGDPKRPTCALPFKRPTCTKPPHLSSYEKEGLLILIQRMKEEHLFEMEACVPQPSHLLDCLRSQLSSPQIEVVFSREPSGVGLLPSPLHLHDDHGLIRKRARPRQCGQTEQKRRKQNGSFVKEPSCIQVYGAAADPPEANPISCASNTPSPPLSGARDGGRLESCSQEGGSRSQEDGGLERATGVPTQRTAE